MSVRQSGAQCPGMQIPYKPRSGPGNLASRRRGDRAYGREEQVSSKLLRTRSTCESACAASVATSERMFRSRETVEAWLESSPTSVLEDLDDESGCSPSSFESFNSSPAGSVIDHLSCTTRFQCPPSKSKPPGHTRSRTISPPRCTANKNSVDLSRIDPAYYSSGSFLVLAFKNAQYRGSSTPAAFQYMSADDHVESLNVEDFGSCRSEFSLTSEWESMLAAGNAAGMSTRDSVGNISDFEAPGEVLNISDLDLDSDVSNRPAKSQVVRAPHQRTRSMEIPRMYYRSASGDLKCSLVDNSRYTCASAKLERSQADTGTVHERGPVRKLSRRNSISFSSSLREAFGSVEKRKVRSTIAAGDEAQCADLISRYEREKEMKSWEDYRGQKGTSTRKPAELKRVHREGKMPNGIAMERSKVEESKAAAEAKRESGKAAKAVTEPKPIRRTSRINLGCLFLL